MFSGVILGRIMRRRNGKDQLINALSAGIKMSWRKCQKIDRLWRVALAVLPNQCAILQSPKLLDDDIRTSNWH